MLKVEQITKVADGHSVAVCEGEIIVPSRLATVASGAASVKLLEYEVGGAKISVQTAYGMEVEVENNPYDPSLMFIIYYKDYMKQKVQSLDTEYPTFLYVMPMFPSGVFFEETCLASRDAMPFDLFEEKVDVTVGNHGYLKAPKYASAIIKILEQDNYSKHVGTKERIVENISMQVWSTLWPQEREYQRAFFLFGLELILLLVIEGIRTFFNSFFRLPAWMWWGFLGSSLSSADLILFSFYMSIFAPNNMRIALVRHLMPDPSGAFMVKAYLTL
ncbi:hypothetical protein GIB67_030783 [Kingdonia uniflora]|uniref:Lycopene epsilon cyclase n=1 Tax=Kingdonia uniflora TaxID=39325 RepID=A0A7J7L362_9MAGN|nr:hypothetical protein GIB67_030783 [Kingdonia uniflora]